MNYNENNVVSDNNNPNDEPVNEIGYPVHVYFIDMASVYMNRIAWQWHPEIEVIIVNHGEICFMTHDTKVILGAGEGVIINANVMHAIEPVNNNTNCSMYSTVFSPAFLFGYGDVLISNKYLFPVISNTSFEFLRLDENDPASSNLLECINKVIADNLIKRFGYELSTKAKLCEFWLALLNLVAPNEEEKHAVKNPSLDESRTKEIIMYIEEHYSERITLDDLAESVHISKSECCRCFKRSLNLSPFEYLIKYRIFKAAGMIYENSSKSLSFSDLAFNVGFNNASYFNKVFKECLGCTPSEYRRRIKANPSFDPFKNISL